MVAAERVKINTFLDLSGHTAGVVQGDPYNEAFRSIIANLNVQCQFVEFSSYEQVLEALHHGWIDAGVLDHLKLGGVTLPDGEVITPIIFSPVTLRVAQPEGSDPRFLEAVDYHLARLKKTPGSAYYQLLEKFFDK